mgnify:CR=1 FL=1
MNIIINIIIRVFFLASLLALQGCGGSTPTLWEDTIVDEGRQHGALVKTGAATISRTSYFNNELTIESYTLDGTAVYEEVKPLDIGEHISLMAAYEGQLLLNTSDLNIVKFNNEWEEVWSYQQQTLDTWKQYTSIDVSVEKDEVILGTFNDQGVPIVSRLVNGEEAGNYTIDNPGVIKVSKVVKSGDYIYAYAPVYNLPYLGVLYVFDEQFTLVAENNSFSINIMAATPTGIIYSSGSWMSALDHQLSKLWTVSTQYYNRPKSVLVSDKIYTLTSKLNKYADGVSTERLVLEAHDFDGNLSWFYEPTSTARALEITSLKLTEVETGGVIVSFSEETSSVADIFDALKVHHTFNIKHRVMSTNGSLRRSITEQTYRFDITPCLGWSCDSQTVFVAEGNKTNMGVVTGSGKDIISLSSVKTESHSFNTSILAAY